MSNKQKIKTLQEMNIKELLDYQDEQMFIYKKLTFEVENWVKTQNAIKNELRARRDELDFLELEAEFDRLNKADAYYGSFGNIH